MKGLIFVQRIKIYGATHYLYAAMQNNVEPAIAEKFISTTNPPNSCLARLPDISPLRIPEF
jgi:hypothetical protein